MDENKTLQSDSLRWVITPEEELSRRRSFFIKGSVLFVALIINAVFFGYQDIIKSFNQEELYWRIGIITAGIVLLIAVLILFKKTKSREYLLEDSGISVSYGNNKKYYPWIDFAEYYIYSERNINKKKQAKIKEMQTLMKEIIGDRIYL